MAGLRIAHFSDVHYTLNPLRHLRESLQGKRVAGWFSYFLGGRRERFEKSGERIAALLEDIDQAGVDHALCTGDLTAVSLSQEFAGIAALFGPRLQKPERFTTLPGNHDRYVESAVRDGLFERHFAKLCPAETAGFPFAKTIADGVRIVGIDAARPTSFANASGLCGEAQRDALARLLAAEPNAVTIVAMHYGLLRWKGGPDNLGHRMLDWQEVLSILDASPARIALIVHGHMHGAFTAPTGKHTLICAGSAMDLLVDCGYFIYDIDLQSLAVRIERRHWSRAQGRFEAVPCPDFEAAVRERRGAKLEHQLFGT